MKDVIEKIEKGKFPPSANNTSDYARGYNTAIEDAVEILQSITPSPSPVTWEEVKRECGRYCKDKVDEGEFGELKMNEMELCGHLHDMIFDYLTNRYPLHPPMEWVNINEATPRLKTYVDVWIEERQMSFMAYMDENFQWQSSYPVVYSSKIEYYKYRDTTKPPSPQK